MQITKALSSRLQSEKLLLSESLSLGKECLYGLMFFNKGTHLTIVFLFRQSHESKRWGVFCLLVCCFFFNSEAGKELEFRYQKLWATANSVASVIMKTFSLRVSYTPKEKNRHMRFYTWQHF